MSEFLHEIEEASIQGLVSGVRITPEVVRDPFTIQREDPAHWWMAVDGIAEITTYKLELVLSADLVRDEQSKLEIKDALEKSLQDSNGCEPFPRYGEKYKAMFNARHEVSIDWAQDELVAGVQGNFTLDMLNGLFESGLIITSLDVAEVYEQASKVEYRSPLFTVDAGRGRDDEDKDNFDLYSRGHSELTGSDSIGEFGNIDDDEKYAKFIRDMREGIPRDIIDEDTFYNMVLKVSVLTLQDRISSPYSSAHALLGDGAPDAGQQDLLSERISRVMQDVIGKEYRFIFEQQDVIEGDVEGARKPINFSQLKEILQDGVRKKMDDDAPSYWLGTAEEWTEEWDRYLEKSREDFDKMWKDRTENPSDPLDNIMEKIREKVKETKEKPKGEKKEAPKGLQLYGSIIPLQADADLSFVGVNHPVENGFGGGINTVYDDIQPDDYLSRNPLLDAPRPIPAALQRLLDLERDHDNTPQQSVLASPFFDLD